MNTNSVVNSGLVPGMPGMQALRIPRVLLVEDDEAVSTYLKDKFELDHYLIETAIDARSAEVALGSQEFDLVVLDLSLPQIDGFQVLARIRARNTLLPILVVTGRTKLEDRVKALDLGADDYVAKPFEYPELAARARALLRRVRPSGEMISRCEDLELDRVGRVVKRSGRTIELTPKEFALLEYFMLNPGRCLTRAMIMEHVWRMPFSDLTNIVDVYINYLRNKVDRGFDGKLIRTMRGAGYQLGDAPSPKTQA
ncbi:MAG: response regulator transcription factor [Terriglobia bacterium]